MPCCPKSKMLGLQARILPIMRKNSYYKYGKMLCLLSVILLLGCNQAKTFELREKGLPDYTIKALELAKPCNCELDDNNKVICNCKREDWEQNIRIVCQHPPNDLNDLVKKCVVNLQNK